MAVLEYRRSGTVAVEVNAASYHGEKPTEICSHYNDVSWSMYGLDKRPTPSLDLFQRWDQLAAELISAMHQPPGSDPELEPSED